MRFPPGAPARPRKAPCASCRDDVAGGRRVRPPCGRETYCRRWVMLAPVTSQVVVPLSNAPVMLVLRQLDPMWHVSWTVAVPIDESPGAAVSPWTGTVTLENIEADHVTVAALRHLHRTLTSFDQPRFRAVAAALDTYLVMAAA